MTSNFQKINLDTPVGKIPRVSASYEKKLARLGIETVADLIFHFPHRYEDFSEIIPIGKIKIDSTVCIKGKIEEIKNIRTWHKKITLTEALVKDQSGNIKVVWFNQPYLIRSLKKGDWVCLAGKASWRGKEIYLSNPIHEKIQNKELVHTGRIIPVYPATAGLSSRWLRYILKPLLGSFKNKLEETIPAFVLKEEGLMPISAAIWQIHFPDSMELARRAQARFTFEELLIVQLSVLRQKMVASMEKSIPLGTKTSVIKEFVASLPFKLTQAQRRTAWEILKNMEKESPMSRLLQGDVGAGKTIVALIAILNTAKNNWQTALMAPTEILANQHFSTACQFLESFSVSIGLMTGTENKLKPAGWREAVATSKKEMLAKLKKGEIDFIIGTHALIQKGIYFKKLGLVVLDEQHRFGVDQRDRLLQQKEKMLPHLLSMTATPIPRSLALSIYGHLDLSTLDETPPGRKKTITKLVMPEKRKEAYGFIKGQIKKGRQAFVICPRIEESQNLNSVWAETKTVKKEFARLSQNVFPKMKLAMLHGKIKPEEKEAIMKKFKKGDIDILVSTSVVEVGIDIPNASVMMIEGAEKFGLAQLHQFRGRVGRTRHQSYCFLLSSSSGKEAKKRLRIMVKSNDGFELAEKDLEIRGPGDFIGQRQSGIGDLAMQGLKSQELVIKTRKTAKQILKQNPNLEKYPVLKQRMDRFNKRIHLE